MGRKCRLRSIENVVDELEYIKHELPQVREVFFEDDTLTLTKVNEVIKFLRMRY
jgi:PII-like signaling protein